MTQTTKWRPKYIVHDAKKYQRSNRPAAVSHNQFVNKASVPSKVVVPESSGLYARSMSVDHQSKAGSNEYSKLKASSRLNVNAASAVKAFREIQTSHIGNNELNTSHAEMTAYPPCSVLMNSKKRITQRMKEENNLERDSGNSSPTDLNVNFESVSYPALPKV